MMHRTVADRRDRWCQRGRRRRQLIVDIGARARSTDHGRPRTLRASARQHFYHTIVPPHLVTGITRRRFHPHRRGIPRPRVVFRDVVRTSSALSDDDRRRVTTDGCRLARESSRNDGDHPLPKSQITIITKTQIAIDRSTVTQCSVFAARKRRVVVFFFNRHYSLVYYIFVSASDVAHTSPPCLHTRPASSS